MSETQYVIQPCRVQDVQERMYIATKWSETGKVLRKSLVKKVEHSPRGCRGKSHIETDGNRGCYEQINPDGVMLAVEAVTEPAIPLALVAMAAETLRRETVEWLDSEEAAYSATM